MNDNETRYQAFADALRSSGIEIEGVSLVEKSLMGKIYDNVCSFLVDNGLVPGEKMQAMENFSVALESLSSTQTLEHIGNDKLIALCKDCDIQTDQIYPALLTVGRIMTCDHSMSEHFEDARGSIEGLDVKVASPASVFGDRAASFLHRDAIGAQEAFGQDIDKMNVDIKVYISIAMMRFHKNIIDRVMFRRPCTANLVKLKVPFAEVYDLEKASAATSAERNSSDHKVPFVNLYKTPEVANTAAKKIIPLKDNDTAGDLLVEDSKMIFGKNINLFDLANDPTKFGHSHIDWTDLVSEGVQLDTVGVEVIFDDAGTPRSEIFEIKVLNRNGAMFQMRNNARDSADRDCLLKEKVNFSAETELATGVAGNNLAAFTGNALLQLDIQINGDINLKTADTSVRGSISGAIVTTDGEDAVAAVETAFAALTFELAYYTLDARYSEENMRKSTAAVRVNTRPMAFEIPVGKNVIVDYSLQQTKPEDALSYVSQLLAIGNDVRALELIENVMEVVYNRIQQENGGTVFADHRDRVAFDYAAGMKVLPSIYLGTLDVASMVTSVRTSDILGDVRGAVEKWFIELFARLHNDSMYVQALDPGEKPVYKVITSGPILSTIFNVPHVHNHLNQPNTADGDIVEFRRVLPDGTIMELITSTFNRLVDKIIVIPYRKGKPESELNFGMNCDRGTFVAQYTPTTYGASNRRIAVNAREIVYPTNPIGALITVSDITALFDGLASLGK